MPKPDSNEVQVPPPDTSILKPRTASDEVFVLQDPKGLVQADGGFCTATIAAVPLDCQDVYKPGDLLCLAVQQQSQPSVARCPQTDAQT